MSTDLLVEEIRIKAEQRRDATLAAVAPRVVKSLATKQQELDAVTAERDALRDNSVAAVEQGRNLLLSLGEESQRLGVLHNLQSAVAGVPVLTRAALAELLHFQLRGDNYAQARWINASAEVARINAIAPVLPQSIEESQASILALQAEIRQVGKDAGIELPKLLNFLRAEAREGIDKRLHVYFESGFFDFAK